MTSHKDTTFHCRAVVFSTHSIVACIVTLVHLHLGRFYASYNNETLACLIVETVKTQGDPCCPLLTLMVV